MAIIKVPKPPGSAFNKGRAISTQLRAQLEHLQQAEFRLAASQQTDIYINAIKTEGEAAEYVRRVTQAVHRAHGVEPRGAAAPDIAAVAKEKAKGKGKGSEKRKYNAKRKT